jgi:hypothetical protein
MDLDCAEIRAKVLEGLYVYSAHADVERRADALSFSEIRQALLLCEMLEHYPDTGRGPSCLVCGFVGSKPIHIVCARRGEALAIVTVYIPGPPKFADAWTRRKG